MKKILLSFFVIGIFAAYAIHQKQEGDASHVTAPISLDITPTSMPNIGTEAPSSSSVSPTLILNPNNVLKGQYKDGTYVGNAVDVYYGNVQVQVIITNGKITDIQFLQYPNDRQTSREISNQAMPYLKQEAIQAQSASVEIVTGASQTSEGFVESMRSALDKAKS